MECPDCYGNGFWLGVMFRHECESCEGTGVLAPEPPMDEVDAIPFPILDDDTDPLWALYSTMAWPGGGGDDDPDDTCD